MSLNVLWRNKTGSDAARRLAEELEPDVDLRVVTDPAEAEKDRGWYQVLVDGSPSEKLLDADGLEHVVVPYAGVSERLRQMLLERPQLKAYNAHFNDAFVAQHAVALLLAVANRVVPGDRALRQGDWTQGGSEHPESLFLEGKRCLLLGYGAIGRAIEPRVRGLGMEVSAYRRNPEPDAELRVYGPDELREALAQAEVVIVSLPSTPATRNLLDEAALAALKPGGVVVNVGRGDVIDERALYRALESRHLFGAGLDVWWRYPRDAEARSATLPAEAPFHELDNVVLSPHRANEVHGWEEASFRDVAETLRALARGESRNRVDPEAGY